MVVGRSYSVTFGKEKSDTLKGRGAHGSPETVYVHYYGLGTVPSRFIYRRQTGLNPREIKTL